MDQMKIERINELSKKQRAGGLSDEEKAEQAVLREEYLENIRRNFRSILENVEFDAKQ